LFNHDPDTVIGLVKLSDSPTGLRVIGVLNLEVARAREVWALLKQRAITGLRL
jgi:phage head maturation protease